MSKHKILMIAVVLAIPLLFLFAYLYGETQPYHPFPEQGTAMLADPLHDLPFTVCVDKYTAKITTFVNRSVTLKSHSGESLFVESKEKGATFVVTENGRAMLFKVFKVMAEPTSYQIWGLTPDNQPVYFDQGDLACYDVSK